MNIIDHLKERGFIDQITSEELVEVTNKPIKFYVGFDPTADSLHVGHLVGIMALMWFKKFGHEAYALIGGATARIGDPSGKSSERPLLEDETIAANVLSIQRLLEGLFKRHVTSSPVIFNNDDWFKSLSFVNFMRDIGKHFRVNVMLTKESVKARLSSEEGISYTEFSYQVMQAYDYYFLAMNHGISLQLGGSDQWGNITAGIELIRKLLSKTSYGLTFPLLTRSDGKKIGKSEKGAIWLSPDKLSPYEFYQYLVKTSDADVISLMRMLTFMEMKEIHEYEKMMSLPDYVPNTAQKRLAEEVTRFVHGEEGLEIALRVTDAAAPGKVGPLDTASLEEIAKDMPHFELSKESVIGKKYVDIASIIGLTSSKSEAVRLVSNGGAYLNNERIDDVSTVIEKSHLIDDKFLLFGMGKKKKILLSCN